MAVKIYFTSLKGGAGVTSVCVGLGCALASLGERTLIVDGDATCSGALFTAGVSHLSVYNLLDAQNGACRVKQTLLQHPSFTNLYFMPTAEGVQQSFICDAVKETEGLFDFVLCDKAAAKACDSAAVVTEPYPYSLRCADKALSRLKDSGFSDASVIVNKVNGGLVFDGEIMTPQEIASLLRVRLTAVIPEDLLLSCGKCKNATAKAFTTAAERLRGKSDKILSVVKPYAGISGFIKRKMRQKI